MQCSTTSKSGFFWFFAWIGAQHLVTRRGKMLGLALLMGALALSGCSLKRLAVNRLGDALSSGASVYATDDDPELVGAALPFGLKTIESLLLQSPHHKGSASCCNQRLHAVRLRLCANQG